MAVFGAGIFELVPTVLATALYLNVFGRAQSASLLLLLFTFTNASLLLHLLDTVAPLALVKIVASIGLVLFVLQVLWNLFTRLDGPLWHGPTRVLLFPCRTTHSRLFPKKHSFSYSYLVVGIPVGWEGVAGGLVSCGVKAESSLSSWFSLKQSLRKGWFDVDAADYLQHGDAHLGLRGKLSQYLKSQDVDPAKYTHAYLVTAARFLGYHFNPASFWYLYGADGSLSAMIVEVNNTFDERRMYFLEADCGNQIQDADALLQNNVTPAASRSLRQTWPKDFHVSPFNSRKGSYSMAANDPLAPLLKGDGPISNTISLRSSKGHGKMVARLFSDGPAVDPSTIGPWQKTRFLASWWWVGFVTFPRIVKEAGVLFLRRNLHVWFRPEPLKESIGRKADAMESRLEPIFRRYLRHLVRVSSAAVTVKYIPSGVVLATKELMVSSAARDNPSKAEELEFKVLTPVFYSRFIHYAHDLEALFCEFRESCTVWVSRPDLLPKIVLRKPLPPLETSSYVDYCIFKAIQSLRRRPERIERPLTSSAAPAGRQPGVDIRDFRMSSMDGYVLEQEEAKERRMYMCSVLKLFIADRVALGSVALLDGLLLVVQLWLGWLLCCTTNNVVAKLR